MVDIVQISKHAYPFNGGQEIYIRELNDALENYNINTFTYSNGTLTPDKIFSLGPRLKGIDRLIKDISWLYFNFLITINRRKYKKAKKVIIHYAIHNSSVKHKNKIILSHGVDWRDDRLVDRVRKKASKKLLNDTNVSFVVANDRNFLKKIGFEYWETIAPFSRIGKFWYIPNVAPKEFQVSYNNSELRQNYILVPRNIRPERGIMLAIKTLNFFNDSGCRMIIAGGPLGSLYHKKCLELSDSLGLSDRIDFLGSIPHSQMEKLYQECKYVLIPTEEQEGTSIAALEAIECGTPVISTNVGGLKDLPTIKSLNITPKALAEALQLVLNDWSNVRNEQFRVVKKNFSYHSWKNAWLEIVND